MTPRLDAGSPPFRGSEARRRGRVSWDALRGDDFVRLAPDSYAGALHDPDDVAVRVATLDVWARGRGVVAGPLAALALDADCPWTDAELVLPSARRLAPPGVAVRTDRLGPDDVVRRRGVLLTSPRRTAFDLARRGPLVEAVAAVDALAHRHRFGVASLRRLVDDHPRARGIVAARRVLDLVDPLAESLMETRLRLGLADHGVPPPVLQYELDLPGYGRVRLDLAWPRPPRGRRPFALEYDGPTHRTIAGQNRDLRRDAALDRCGWDVRHVGSEQVLAGRHAEDLAVRVLARVT